MSRDAADEMAAGKEGLITLAYDEDKFRVMLDGGYELKLKAKHLTGIGALDGGSEPDVGVAMEDPDAAAL